MRTSENIALGTALALLFLLVQISPCLSDQGETSGREMVPDLSGIWSIEGLEEVGGVVIALEQNGSQLYGRAKYEPDSGEGWNGQVIGSATGDGIELVIASGQDDVLVSRRLLGRYEILNQSILGQFIQTFDGQVINQGHFVAIIINPDTSLYSPAIIGRVEREDFKAVTEHMVGKKATGGGESRSNLTYPAEISPSNQTMQENRLADSGYYDVHRDLESILTGVCSPGPSLS